MSPLRATSGGRRRGRWGEARCAMRKAHRAELGVTAQLRELSRSAPVRAARLAVNAMRNAQLANALRIAPSGGPEPPENLDRAASARAAGLTSCTDIPERRPPPAPPPTP